MPADPPAQRTSPPHPARVMLDSPLAAATRAGIHRRRSRQPPRARWRRVLGLVGTLLIHLLFLFGFVLGPAYQLKLPPPPKEEPLQVRLIELPELPPPPPVKGTPPREVGPRHQGHAAVSPRQPRAASASLRAVMPPAVIAPATPPPAVAAVAPQVAVEPVPPAPDQSPPMPVALQPIAVTGAPPVVTLPKPVVPQPPAFQPEPVRPAQVEGSQPVLPPASLALPNVPTQTVVPIRAPTLALNAPASVPLPTPARVTPARAQVPVATPAAELQAIPLATPGAPRVTLQTAVAVVAPAVVRALPRVAPAALQPQASPAADALPSTDIAQPALRPAPPALKVAVADSTKQPAIEPAIERPALAAAPAAPTTSRAAPAIPEAGASAAAADVTRAPDAIAQGSDDATLGTTDGTASAVAPASITAASAADTSATGAGKDAAAPVANPRPGSSKQGLSGLPGGDRPGADQGARQGEPTTAPGGYVQLTPQGDTRIMRHGAPNIGYKPTRFDKDWTPDGESSIDTALRRAIEKTTVKHTFHLPRGVRVECAVSPLLPVALFGCRNPDPPAVPVAQKVYDRLHLPSANPLLPPAPASTAPPANAAPIHLDNSALCATAHIAGGPPPPGCETVTLPVKLVPAPASSSLRSWVPASDQFH